MRGLPGAEIQELTGQISVKFTLSIWFYWSCGPRPQTA